MNELETRMKDAAANLEFEEAARLRDEIKRLEAADLGMTVDGKPLPKGTVIRLKPSGKPSSENKNKTSNKKRRGRR